MVKKRHSNEHLVTTTTWRSPKLDTSELQHRYGDSVLLEFVRGHGPSAVLRELIQNEYDAGGSALQVVFNETELEVRGNGTPIDQRGWRRLSVTLGTGSVSHFKDELKEKENGIGSKNFGLRSLFLFGDRIYVRSNGRQTLLDLYQGALETPQRDLTTDGMQGVRIHVPYRVEPSADLNAFTEDFEVTVLDEFATHISPSLLKLAHPSNGKNLRSVTVSSARAGREIVWKQKVRQLPSNRGTRLLKRRITMNDSKSEKTEIEEEYEWQKSFELPSKFRHQRIPSYFKDRGAQIRVGISLRTRRGKLSPGRPVGIAYYPIGVAQAFTGNCVSICAPFEMNADRSELLDPSNSAFNQWLLGLAAEMSISLLQTDWFNRFGADAYHAVGDISQSVLPLYTEAVQESLRNAPCWPSRDVSRGKRLKVQFTSASKLNMVSDPSLDQFLNDDKYLHPGLCKTETLRSLASYYGVKKFTLNSLIRLRCAGKSPDTLQSQCRDEEANYYYTEFPADWRDVSIQRRCAAALDKNRNKLSQQNRRDLASSETTITANMSLAAPENLWFVPREILAICPVPEEQCLHLELTESVALRKLCKRYKIADWIENVARRAKTGQADEQELISLYKYILSTSGKVPRRVLAVVRNSPVFRDRDENWVLPKSITSPGMAGIRRFSPALHLPHRDYVKDKALAKVLRFKNKVTGDDVVRFAEIVSTQPELAQAFEQALERSSNLLSPRTIKRLAQIEFIRSSDGHLRSPPSLYLRTSRNLVCIGTSGPYPASSKSSLFTKLGCRLHPTKEQIMENLVEFRQKGQPPARLDILYPELVGALGRESTALNIYEDEDILWTGNGYSAPADTILGEKWNKIFLGYVSTISTSSASMKRTYLELGVREQPEQRHWKLFFLSVGEHYRANPSPLPNSQRKVIHSAYVHCLDIPSLPSDVPWLLDDTGNLHTTPDAISGRFVIEDDVPLGTELRSMKAPVSFADGGDPKIASIFRKQGVKLLTEVRQKIRDRIGRRRDTPNWFRDEEYLRLLKNPDFGSALKAMAGRDFPGNTLEQIQRMMERLTALKKIVFAEDIYVDYRIGETKLAVSADFAWKDDEIHLAWVRSRAGLVGMLASLIAGECIPDVAAHARFSDSVFRLINCENSRDIQNYLELRGIRWHPVSKVDDEDDVDYMRDLEEIVRTAVLPRNSSQEATIPKLSGGVDQTESTDKPDTDTDAPITLPPINEVNARIVESSSNWTYSPSVSVRSLGGGGGWSRGSRDEERDRVLGPRGEEIVYALEKARVCASGYPEERVIWVAESNPMSDFDIESVDEDGERLFIEVKSTAGTDGRFHWSLPEFQRAIQERNRYLLYRVYKANTLSPVIRQFRNPVSLLSCGGLHLDIESFRAVVQPVS